jgi:hypothetical protein
MKVLAVIYANRVPDNDRLYEGLAQHVETLEVRRVSGPQARRLDRVISGADIARFDRIVLEIRAKHALAQARFLRTIPQLVLFEEDTWQNYVGFTKNQGLFLHYYRAVQPKRIIHSGFAVAEKTRAFGFDSVCLPKGYDGSRLWNEQRERDIPAAFVGRIAHDNYGTRKALLETVAAERQVALLRTQTPEEYRQTLSRIRVFVSADVGFGEHMIKNFEALACGCVLLAHRQPVDDDALGFRHLENVVLYEGTEDCIRQLDALKGMPGATLDGISAAGQALAEARHEHHVLARRYADLLAPPLAASCEARLPYPGAGMLQKLRRALRR